MVLGKDVSQADSGMEDFGYRESLDRSIGKFASFAAGVSYISILTGTFQLFYFGYGTAGPAYLWSWPIVFVGQMAVALCFMELAAKYPVAGSVYNWSKKLASRLVGEPHLRRRYGNWMTNHRPKASACADGYH